MEKNVAGKWIVFAYGLPDNATPGVAITGDAANITANVRIDGGAANAVDDVNPTELEDGYYVFDLTATETNGDLLLITPASSTADVQVIGVPGAQWTRPANFNALGIASDGDISGNVDGNVVGSAGSVVGAVGSVTGAVGSVTGAVGSVTGSVGSLVGHTVQTGDTYALANGSAGFVAIDTVVDTIAADVVKVPKSDGTTSWNVTALAAINAEVDTALTDYGANTTTPPTVGAIADQVWVEAIADHSGTGGSTAEQLAAAGAAGDPWSTALPGAYGAGTAGKIVGDNVNATISSRMAEASISTTAGAVDVVTLVTTTTTNTDMRGTDSAATSAKQDTMETTLNDVPTTAEFNARTLAAAAYFDPAADAVANVTLVATTTTNTDMRGTDSAATAAALSTAQSDLDKITGSDGATLATTQANYAPATAAALATVDAVVDNLNLGIIYGAAATGTLSTTEATSDLTGYTDDQLIGRVIIFTSGAADGEGTDITDYANTNGHLTFTALTTAPGNGDTFKIV